MEENILIEYRKTGDILKDTEAIVEAASRAARTTVNVLLGRQMEGQNMGWR